MRANSSFLGFFIVVPRPHLTRRLVCAMAASGSGGASGKSARKHAAADVLANAALGSGRERLHPSTFGAMFCEFVAYFRSSVEALEDLERK